MNTYISELLGAGADAMTNMYEVGFEVPVNASTGMTTDEVIKLRIRTDGFTPPTDSHQTYEVHWKTVSIPRPATKIVMDRQFAITFRVDANWDLYKTLLKWKALTSIGSVGYATQELKEASLGKVTIKALKAAIEDASDVYSETSASALAMTDANILWKYYDVWVESITNPDFSTEGSDPVKVTATFRFGRFDDLASPALKG